MSELQTMDLDLAAEIGDPLPLWLELRPERVQITAPTDDKVQRKLERVRERLQGMPGWHLVLGGTALVRVRDLKHAPDAADYANFVAQAASRAHIPVDVFVAGKRVVLALHGRGGCGGLGAVNDNLLDFAARLA